MTEGWKTVKLGDICKTGAGGTPLKSKREYYEGGTIPWLQSGEVAQGNITQSKKFITEEGLANSSAKMFPKDTVLVAMYGATAGQVGILRFPASTNQAVCGIYPNDKTVPEYLFYAFMFKKDELIAKATGNAQPNISQIKIKNTEIPFPPLEEQKRIVAILDEAFEGIEKAQANAEQNLANARELFESYMNAIFNQANSKYKAARIADICTIRPPKREALQKLKSNDKVSFVAMENLGILAKDLTLNTERALKDVQGSYTYFAENDVLLAKITPCFENGKLGIARNLTNGIGFGSSEYIVIRSGDNINPDFLFYFLSQKKFRETGAKLMTGACGHKRVPKEYVEDCLLPVPPISQQDEIIEKLDSISAETARMKAIYEQKLKDLAELKQSLLQKAFSGELTKASSTSNVIPFPQLSPDEAHIGTIAYGYRRHEGTDHFTTYLRTKSEKIVHLIEYQTGIDMGRAAVPMARGPYDPDARERVETQAKASNYFETYDNGRGIAIRRLANFDEIAKQAEAFYGDKKAEVDRIIDLFLPLNHEEAEVRATVYAAWNNLLIDGEDITDEKIVTAAREDWHIEKENIERPKFFNAIRWLEKNNLVPQGQGKRVGDKRLL